MRSTVGRACRRGELLLVRGSVPRWRTSAFAHKRLRELIRTPLLMTEHVRGVEPKADFVLAGAPTSCASIRSTTWASRVAEDRAPRRGAGARRRDPRLRPGASAPYGRAAHNQLLRGGIGRSGLPERRASVYACGYSDQLDCVDADGTVPVPTGPGSASPTTGTSSPVTAGSARVSTSQPEGRRAPGAMRSCRAAPAGRVSARRDGAPDICDGVGDRRLRAGEAEREDQQPSSVSSSEAARRWACPSPVADELPQQRGPECHASREHQSGPVLCRRDAQRTARVVVRHAGEGRAEQVPTVRLSSRTFVMLPRSPSH